ncbi:MAG: aminopeptidase P family protein [Bradymonadia bacterium]
MSEIRFECLRKRREAVLKSLDGREALIAAGLPSSRNFQANCYPFRASSHFLHLAGAALPGGFLHFKSNRVTLYVPRQPEGDVLWHGQQPGPPDLADSLGVEVRYTDELNISKAAMALPTMNEATNQQMSGYLERVIQVGHISKADYDLAMALVLNRLQHDEWAQSELRVAAQITADAHELARRELRPGATCRHVSAVMRSHFESRSMAYAYQPIITPRGEVLHEHKLDTRMESGDLVLLDVGGEMPSGYAADVTRTWPVNQRMSKTQRMIYQIVERAHKVAVDAVAPGVEYAEIHALAARELVVGLVDVGILLGDPESLFAQNMHTAFFPHGVGHLLGLDVHDMEDLGDLAGYAPGRARRQAFGWSFLRLDRQLKEGMVVTIEPGFYMIAELLTRFRAHPRHRQCIDWEVLAQFSDVRGIRLEDDVLVTSAGRDILSRPTA